MTNKMKFDKRSSEIPEDHVEIVNITTDGDKSLSVNFNEPLMMLAEDRHLKIMLAAPEDAFYRLRPDLRRM